MTFLLCILYKCFSSSPNHLAHSGQSSSIAVTMQCQACSHRTVIPSHSRQCFPEANQASIFLATIDIHLTGRRPEQAFLGRDIIDGEWTARSCLGKTALFVSGHESTQGVVCWVRGLFRGSIRGWFGASFPHFSCQGSLSAWWVRTVWSASESPSLAWAGGGCLL